MAATRITTQDIKDAAVTAAKLGVLTTKGDILIRDNTGHTRLPIGADGTILKADSSNANGMVWAAFTGLATANFVHGEVPGGTVNGVNDTFTLSNAPSPVGSERIFKNGLRQKSGAGNDYTIAGATITFLAGNIPQTGDNLLADYLK